MVRDLNGHFFPGINIENIKALCTMGNETKNRVRIIKRIWKLTKRRKPRTIRIYPEIRNEEGIKHTDPHGVTKHLLRFTKVYIRNSKTHISTLTSKKGSKTGSNI